MLIYIICLGKEVDFVSDPSQVRFIQGSFRNGKIFFHLSAGVVKL